MRAPSHGRTSGHLAKRGPGLSPCFQVRRCERCSPSHIIHRMHVYCAWGKGFAHRLHRRATPARGVRPGRIGNPAVAGTRGRRSAKRQQSGDFRASPARKPHCGQPPGPRAAWCHPLHAQREAATPGPAAVCGAVWQWAASQPVRARTHVFTRPRFPWVWTRAGREPWPTLLGGQTHRREQFRSWQAPVLVGVAAPGGQMQEGPDL
jgi:hypothetical protein